MLVLILGVLCSVMLLFTVILSGKHMEMTHHANSLQRSVDIYTSRSRQDWDKITKLLKANKEAQNLWEFAKNDAQSQRKLTETYKALYRDAVKESQELRDEKQTLREQLANKQQECILIARELESYIEKFEGDN